MISVSACRASAMVWSHSPSAQFVAARHEMRNISPTTAWFVQCDLVNEGSSSATWMCVRARSMSPSAIA